MDETLGTGTVEPIGNQRAAGWCNAAEEGFEAHLGAERWKEAAGVRITDDGELAYMATVNLRNGVHKHRHPEPVL
ncbi:hypothetical protein [Paenibacillus sp. NPDC057967]|uniref:hypothetical protein n=1 Tax=Paenibacillus sp. NPDC057967 TaxID=3346293 RepID=UPI0036DB6123